MFARYFYWNIFLTVVCVARLRLVQMWWRATIISLIGYFLVRRVLLRKMILRNRRSVSSISIWLLMRSFFIMLLIFLWSSSNSRRRVSSLIVRCWRLLAPYLTRHLKRYGDFVIDLTSIPFPLDGAISIPLDSE